MKSLLLCALLLWPSGAWAMSTGLYDITPNQEFSGSFSYDAALASTNPFTAFDFRYDWPNVGITGQAWQTDNGSFWLAGGSQSLYVTNAENITLNFQLCFSICSEAQNTYAMWAYDNVHKLRYGAGGAFTLRTTETFASVAPTTQSVPEPQTGLLLGVGMLLIIFTSFIVTHAKARLKADHFIE